MRWDLAYLCIQKAFPAAASPEIFTFLYQRCIFLTWFLKKPVSMVFLSMSFHMCACLVQPFFLKLANGWSALAHVLNLICLGKQQMIKRIEILLTFPPRKASAGDTCSWATRKSVSEISHKTQTCGKSGFNTPRTHRTIYFWVAQEHQDENNFWGNS